MMWESTPDNIIQLMRSVIVAKRAQLVSFFEDAHDGFNVEFYIDQLVRRRVLDEENGTLMLHAAPKITDIYRRNIIKSMWIVASFKSNNVCEVFLLPYPSTICFITKENGTFDISVCTGSSDAQAAYIVRRRSIPEDAIDEVNHIALINREDTAEEIRNFGFDSFCILDRSHRPRYGTWE